MSLLVTEIEVIGGGIVEVYRALDKPEAENAGVEIEIALRVTGYAGDMMDTGSAEAHRTDSCLAFLRDLSLVGAGAGRGALTAIAALVLIWVGRNVFGIGPSGTCAGIAVALFCRGSIILFLVSFGCHNISSLDPSIKATAMPFAEALM